MSDTDEVPFRLCQCQETFVDTQISNFAIEFLSLTIDYLKQKTGVENLVTLFLLSEIFSDLVSKYTEQVQSLKK